MAIEPRRGCGFRKINGLYLVGGGIAKPCDRLPLTLCLCPTCGAGIKQTRGWTWIDVSRLIEGPHVSSVEGELRECSCELRSRTIGIRILCTFCHFPKRMGRAGLLWIGEKFYATPADFVAEGMNLGFSRRIKSIPRGFKAGETWVLLAHPKAVHTTELDMEADEQQDFPLTGAPQKVVYKPGVFYVWLPQRIEKILPESARGSEEVTDLEKRGITPVFVPTDDPDHQGSVHDDPESGQACLEEA